MTKENKVSNENDIKKIFGVVCIVSILIFAVTSIFYLVNGKRVILETHLQKYEVIGINPPKHFSLDLKNVNTGEVFEDVFISKRCQYWENLKMNSIVSFEEETYKYEKRDHVQKDVNVNYDFCQTLNN